MSMKGYILQAQNFSVNDGDGIRTTVFLAGCPLHCQWCSNPEGLDTKFKVAYYKEHCVGCGLCASVCPQGIGIDLNLEREKCISCGRCVEACLNHARKNLVEYRSVDSIVDEIKNQVLFFRNSGGGVTFSGGEATMQVDFLTELAQKLYDMGISLAMESSAYFDFDKVKPVLKMLDLLFVDIKHMDNEKHKEFTGVSNQKILENIKKLKDLQIPVVVRVPVIKGVNADAGNIRETAEFVHTYLPDAKMELLPYHNYGEAKYESLGLSLPSASFDTPSEEEMKELKEIIIKTGVGIADFR